MAPVRSSNLNDTLRDIPALGLDPVDSVVPYLPVDSSTTLKMPVIYEEEIEEATKSLPTLEVESVSGLVELNYLVADEISVETVSGNINLLLEGDSDDYCIHTEKVMDEQYIDNGGFRTLEIETVSGYINYSFIE